MAKADVFGFYSMQTNGKILVVRAVHFTLVADKYYFLVEF